MLPKTANRYAQEPHLPISILWVIQLQQHGNTRPVSGHKGEDASAEGHAETIVVADNIRAGADAVRCREVTIYCDGWLNGQTARRFVGRERKQTFTSSQGSPHQPGAEAICPVWLMPSGTTASR